MSDVVDLSVVIATRNNATRLEGTLHSLARCAKPAGTWEIVLVENGCEDDTCAVAERRVADLPLRLVHEPRVGVSRARNAGVRAALGKLILFTDDDVEFSEAWIREYEAAHERLGSGHLFGGPIESRFEGRVPDRELLDLAPASVRGLDWGAVERVLSDREGFVGANWACERADIERVGGYDERLGPGARPGGVVATGEEADLMYRLRRAGLEARYLPNARVAHWVVSKKATLQHVGRRKEAYAWCLAVTGRASMGDVSAGLGALRRRRFKKWARLTWRRLRGTATPADWLAWYEARGLLRGTMERERLPPSESAEPGQG